MNRRIILASSSPRRRELLSQAGIPFEVVVSGCDEAEVPGEGPQAMVERLALLKAETVAREHPEAVVIGADTTVWIDDRALGKPESAAAASEMLARIAGRSHEVWGGIAVLSRAAGVERVWSHQTRVTMVALDAATIEWYVRTGEPMDKAGSYAIQGLGAQLVWSIEGSYSNVVGLNIAALVGVLDEYLPGLRVFG
jgi:septum formation protein